MGLFVLTCVECFMQTGDLCVFFCVFFNIKACRDCKYWNNIIATVIGKQSVFS